jgi:hypothetical protein
MNMHHLINLYRPLEAMHLLRQHVETQQREVAELIERAPQSKLSDHSIEASNASA